MFITKREFRRRIIAAGSLLYHGALRQGRATSVRGCYIQDALKTAGLNRLPSGPTANLLARRMQAVLAVAYSGGRKSTLNKRARFFMNLAWREMGQLPDKKGWWTFMLSPIAIRI